MKLVLVAFNHKNVFMHKRDGCDTFTFWQLQFYDFCRFKRAAAQAAQRKVDEELLVSLAGAPIRPIAQKCAKWVRVL